jgi:hypothetical protein
MMSRTDTIAKIVLYTMGVLATVAFVITKNATALNWATDHDYQYGDLYRFAQVARFKGHVTLGPTRNRDSMDNGQERPNDTESLFFGDSFAFCDAGEGTFAAQLAQKTESPMFTVYRNNHASFVVNPYLLLNSLPPSQLRGRILVYEIVERLIDGQFSAAIPPRPIQPPPNPLIDRFWLQFKGTMFDNAEGRSESLLKHCLVTSPIVACWNTAIFELFGRISPETPLYSLHPPFLFFSDEAQCFQTTHSSERIATFADNIALFDRDLRERFGLTLLFIPIPDKITLYSGLATPQPYDKFLPRLSGDLKSRGVHTVDMLPALQADTNLLYWPSDTHWNGSGIRVGVEQAAANWPRPKPK